jgi:hypothetical protein
MSTTKTPDFSRFFEDFPPIIPASMLPRLLEDAYTKKTLANMRWMGKGPKAHKLGRKVVYLRKDVVAWLCQEIRPIDPDAAA